jgi:hypothetical protein
MKILRNVLLFLLVSLLYGPIAAQAQYDFEQIDYPGAPFTQVFGISDRGDVVGNGSTDTDTFPFVYDAKKGTFTDVAPIAGFDSTAVLGISDSGVLVGSVFDEDLLKESGLIIHQDGSTTVFDHPDAVSFTQARGVNNEGLVTGYHDSADDLFTPENGFIYDPETGTFTDIVPSLFTIAQGINSRGDVVGHALFDGNFGAPDPCGSSDPFLRRGWLRTPDGTVTYFDVNGVSTSARGITDSGTIAGFIIDSVIKGFVVELDGSQCQSISIADADLLAFPGAEATFLGGIKNSGAIVGSYDDPTTTHGFIAKPQ